MNSATTDFGYQKIPIAEKADKVADVFHSVARRYDIMNDLMSLGIHRYWKYFAITLSNVRAGQRVLDVAAGTGDLSVAFAKQVGKNGEVWFTDINASMLHIGRERLIDHGIVNPVRYVQADAESLPFPDNYFDCISIAFGLRNVTNKNAALHAMWRTLKPGGQLLILEFSKPVIPILQLLYEQYSFAVLPKLGQWVTGDASSYQYLVESIRMHPDQDTLKHMMTTAGLENCEYYNLTAGIVALHRGYKF